MNRLANLMLAVAGATLTILCVRALFGGERHPQPDTDYTLPYLSDEVQRELEALR